MFLPVYEVTANHKIRIELPDFSGFNFSTLLLTGRLQEWFWQSISYRRLWTGDLFTDGINYAEDLLLGFECRNVIRFQYFSIQRPLVCTVIFIKRNLSHGRSQYRRSNLNGSLCRALCKNALRMLKMVGNLGKICCYIFMHKALSKEIVK